MPPRYVLICEACGGLSECCVVPKNTSPVILSGCYDAKWRLYKLQPKRSIKLKNVQSNEPAGTMAVKKED